MAKHEKILWAYTDFLTQMPQLVNIHSNLPCYHSSFWKLIWCCPVQQCQTEFGHDESHNRFSDKQSLTSSSDIQETIHLSLALGFEIYFVSIIFT